MLSPEEKNVFPRLRNDLKLLPAPPQDNGSPTWTLHDPVCNSFYRIGWLEFELLARWHISDKDKIIQDILEKTPLNVTHDEIEIFYRFLSVNSLLQPSTPLLMNQLKNKITRPRERFSLWLLKHYLFIRIPLLSPDRFLELTLPIVKIFVSCTFLYIIGFALFLSFFLIMRQWDTFTHTFLYFFSVQGIIWYALAIFISKLIHELGHAYTSKYYGINIPTMGVALLVLFPMLYTDNSEAWKLKSRISRMIIVAAGTLAELVIAVFATLLWSFLPDGHLRSACFILATVTWISSLFMNLSPFMRFDGYYLLSDFLDIPNLQDRAFAMGKWYLRKILLGISAPSPEKFSEQRRRFLILFAYATWLYRLILFTAIAIMVYHLFFKMLGLFFFAVEIGWFVIFPVYRELQVWWKSRESLGCNGNVIISLLLLLLFILILIIPWKTANFVPAILKSAACTRIYPPYSACIQDMPIKNGDYVKAGDLLFELSSPQLEFKEKQAEIRINNLNEQLTQFLSNAEQTDQAQIIQQQLAEALTQLQGYSIQKRQLRITAPSDGIIMDMADGLAPGIWVNKRQLLALMIDRKKRIIEGYLAEDMLENVSTGNIAGFYMESGDNNAISCIVHEIDPTGSGSLKEPYLASTYGGDLPVRYGVHGDISLHENTAPPLISHKSLYRIILIPEYIPDLPCQIVRGAVRIKGKPQSLIHQAWLRISAVLIRESGF